MLVLRIIFPDRLYFSDELRCRFHLFTKFSGTYGVSVNPMDLARACPRPSLRGAQV